jgi:hypothetical protein
MDRVAKRMFATRQSDLPAVTAAIRKKQKLPRAPIEHLASQHLGKLYVQWQLYFSLTIDSITVLGDIEDELLRNSVVQRATP